MKLIKLNLVHCILFWVCALSVHAQINPSEVKIIRDSFGVPHIKAPTDAGAAYGLAWANAEDDFTTMQLGYLAGNALLSKHLGLSGASADFVAQLIRSDEFVATHYESDISKEFKAVLEGFCEGLNAYADSHKKEILVPELFPFTPQKLLAYTYLQLFVMSDATQLVQAITTNQMDRLTPKESVEGSNTFALNSAKTADGATYLAINPHQPLEGPTGWYEAHIQSDEGTNIIGALFPGAPTILIGTNTSLGWSHTVNKPDKADIFQLTLDPRNKNNYLVDGQSLALEKHQARVHIRVLGLSIPVKKSFYTSIYGPTLKNKQGVYAVRTPSLFGIKALQQWWHMNKARNFSEFKRALAPQDIPGFNISYADKYDTIYYVSNARLPHRAAGYDWTKVVPGNTRKTLWDSYYDLQDMPQVLQPTSGYVYNTNHSPFISSGPEDLLNPEEFDASMGFERFNNNRSARFQELITPLEKVTWEDFTRIKFDRSLPARLAYTFMNVDELFELTPENYPGLSELIHRIQRWDRKADPQSIGAGNYAVFYYLARQQAAQQPEGIFSESATVAVLEQTKKYLLKHFQTTEVPLGDFMKVVRGQQEAPSFGLPDVLAAMHGEPYKQGTLKVTAGESYIQLVKFTIAGPEIHSVVPFGSSNRANSPHYADQMPLYLAGKTKSMPLDWDYWVAHGTKSYSPPNSVGTN